jgi:hypothetical protein
MSAATKPPKKPTGRPSHYTPEKASEVVRRVGSGEPLARVCRDDHMPALRTFYDWMERDAELSAQFARARETGEEIIAASALDIADAPPPLTAFGSVDGGAVQHAKLRIETRLKLLAKWNPKKWGDRVQSDVKVTGLGDVLAALDGHALKPVRNEQD